MLNLKKVNFAVIAILLGGTIAMTQSAFTPAKSTAQLYGKLAISGGFSWVLITSDLVQDPSGTDPLDVKHYACDESAVVCKAYFTSTPSNNQNPASGDIQSLGTFRINQ